MNAALLAVLGGELLEDDRFLKEAMHNEHIDKCTKLAF